MKLNFFKRLAEKIRQPFKKEEPQIVPETVAEAETEAIIEAETVVEAETDTSSEAEADTIAGVEIESDPEGKPESGSDNCVKQAQYFLFKEGKPIGKPFGRHPEIRIVYVNNFVESFLFFLRLCDQRLLTYRQTGGHLDCTAAFPDGNGSLTFTDRATCRNKSVIAVLKVEISGLHPRLSEIRFEIKH